MANRTQEICRQQRSAPHQATFEAISQRLHQVAQLTGTQLPKRLFPPRVVVLDGAWSVQACRRLRVDPRWLLLGIRSPAAEAAIQHVVNRGFDHGSNIVALLEMMPEPAIFGRCCRYCACTDDRACPGGCAWIDDDATICSACLEVHR